MKEFIIDAQLASKTTFHQLWNKKQQWVASVVHRWIKINDELVRLNHDAWKRANRAAEILVKTTASECIAAQNY